MIRTRGAALAQKWLPVLQREIMLKENDRAGDESSRSGFTAEKDDAGLHSSWSRGRRRRARGGRQVCVRARRLPFLGRGRERDLARLASAVAGADRLDRSDRC